MPSSIQSFIHCRTCVEEYKKTGKPFSPEKNQRISVGWTKEGIQVWCDRHDKNVMHMDFEGVKHRLVDADHPKTH